MAIINGTDEGFEKEVSEGITFVNFSAPWCGPCKMMAPSLEALSEELEGKVKFVKINVDDHQKTASSLKVRGIPAFFVYKDGEMIENFVGYNSKDQLENQITKHL